MLPLVIDAIVVIFSLLGNGHSLLVFKLNDITKKYQMIYPEFILIELGKHASEIAQRSKLSIEEATKVMDFVSKQIEFIPASKFEDKLNEARQILQEHEKDVPYVALALAFNCRIFSGDKMLKALVPDMVLTPREVLDGFY